MTEPGPEEPIGVAQLGEPVHVENDSDLRTVPIRVYIAGKPVEHSHLWELGVRRRGDIEIWGLVYGGTMTHMCYGTDHAEPTEALAKVRSQNHGWWLFDWGRELGVRIDDLEVAFRTLKLIPTGPDSTIHSGTFGGSPDDPA